VAIFVDSAGVADLTEAASLGYVRGFTTNPALMARATADPLQHFARLLSALPEGPAFYQPIHTTGADAHDEARAAAALAPDRVVIKLGATATGARLAAALTAHGVRCALTAAFAPGQALVAHETGCAWVIPYVDRADRQRVGGLELVASFAGVLARAGSTTRVLAASLKTSTQLADAVLAGAHDVTAPLAVLHALPEHPLSAAAMREFDTAWRAARDDAAPGAS
jgi:transaldolase